MKRWDLYLTDWYQDVDDLELRRERSTPRKADARSETAGGTGKALLFGPRETAPVAPNNMNTIGQWWPRLLRP